MWTNKLAATEFPSQPEEGANTRCVQSRISVRVVGSVSEPPALQVRKNKQSHAKTPGLENNNALVLFAPFAALPLCVKCLGSFGAPAVYWLKLEKLKGQIWLLLF